MGFIATSILSSAVTQPFLLLSTAYLIASFQSLHQASSLCTAYAFRASLLIAYGQTVLMTSYLLTAFFFPEDRMDCIRPGGFGGLGVWTVTLEYARGKEMSTLPGNLVAVIKVRIRVSSTSVFQFMTSRLKVKLQEQVQYSVLYLRSTFSREDKDCYLLWAAESSQNWRHQPFTPPTTGWGNACGSEPPRYPFSPSSSAGT